MSDNASNNTSTNENDAVAANNEALSALLDGVADPLELRRLLASTDPQLAATWSRLNTVQTLIHGEGSELRPVSSNFAARVNAALEAPAVDGDKGVVPDLVPEPVFSGASAAAGSWVGGVAKLAVAASVAVACVVALQMALPTAGPATNSELLATTTPSVIAPVATAPIAAEPMLVAADMQAAEQEAQQRLREYIGRMSFGGDTPVRVEHIQDSPLYRLVSETLEPAASR
ncbi:MAG: sigma-E factor negative regulatory protein [Gammaproteobacteria bacterium]|jgi:sigma-E factor negative regulatory protein RseA|nr:sigma-E factor negative regulatory protein [Gammaproteobacteria bacterium]